MLGTFLEISVHNSDVLQSLQFYEKLGFTQIPGNDTWTHPYGIVTDGRCFIGIHAYAFPAPSLTFVAPDLRKRVEELENHGAQFEFIKLGDDEFHELGFYLPDEQMVTLLEARTFSPPLAGTAESLLGFFAEYRLPVNDREASAERWQRFGLLDNEQADALHETASLCCTGLNLGLTESRSLRQPSLVFHVTDLQERLEAIVHRGIETAQAINGRKGLPAARLVAPEGTHLLLVQAD